MSISDMMSGLMLVFLFIAISFMIEVEKEKQGMKDIAISYRDTKANLNEALYSEFENDLEAWGATITQENSITFNSPEVLFEVSKSNIKNDFKTILEEFFVRYVKVLTSKEYKDEIKELRVEGHTSDKWGNILSEKEIYLKNMQLSQSRAYEVLSYCYSLEDETIKENRTWLEKHFRANGMAFSKLKKNDKARRVEFSIQMKSEDKVYEILK
ncbi:OmpA family protein [Sulfurimonas aquatica]|uniref:OmpA family protein n=1 Tax=Sulfurimonas aquatica TaxID=2672570 RepID=A0A975B1E7_9BACT|nr:OmpA family protein [Sulfurimonas aquatica]QSZ42345.1 OmpA family protein [Sulfurimonas aquatica]